MDATTDPVPDASRELSALTRSEIISRLKRDGGSGFTVNNVRSFARDGRLTQADVETYCPEHSIKGTVAYAQAVIGPWGGIGVFSKQLASIAASMPRLGDVHAPIAFLPRMTRQYDGVLKSTFPNLAGIANVARQLEGYGTLATSWSANIGHIHDFLPTSLPVGGPLSAGNQYQPPPVVALGPNVEQYQLRATRELNHSVEAGNVLLAELKTEVIARRRDAKADRKFSVAGLGADLVVISFSVLRALGGIRL